MRLTSVSIAHFRSFSQKVSVDLSDGPNYLIGPNNCGKSNFLRAVRLALDPATSFDRERDFPANSAPQARPRIELTFQLGSGREATLRRYAEEYEKSVIRNTQETYADRHELHYVVTYQTNQGEYQRQEFLAAKGAGNRRGDEELAARALNQFRQLVSFVAIESGQSVDQLLAGQFREVLHKVMQKELREEVEAANVARTAYVTTLQNQLLSPLRDRVSDITNNLFPELTEVTLVPSVPSIDETLSNVEIFLKDAAETALAGKGTGIAGGVLVALLRYLTESKTNSLILGLEEPETFLHPAAQETLRDHVFGLATDVNTSLLVTTHSPHVISRSDSTSVTALNRTPTGCTEVRESVIGGLSHKAIVSSLYSDTRIPEFLDQIASVPHGALGVLVVEGSTDHDFIRLAASKMSMDALNEGLHIVPTKGAESVIVQVLLLRSVTELPVVALFDSDQNGIDAARRLKKLPAHVHEGQKPFILRYGDFIRNGHAEDAEAEWLFPATLLEKFVANFGENNVVSSKMMKFDEWRYDFTGSGKAVIGDWMRGNASSTDMQRWKPLLARVEQILGIE